MINVTYLLQVLRLSNYNQMQNIPFSSNKSIRLERLASIRTSMKHITLLSKKTIQLETKITSRKDAVVLMEKLNNSEDTFSNQSDSPQPSSDREINSFLAKYELLQKLGEGANACVYKCMHRKTGKIYAAKKIKMQQQHVLQLKRNFINLKQIRHPSIIKYKALYLDIKQHCAYLIMECFNKPSLSECFIQDEKELKLIVKELIRSIQYLHNRNICHRDIKPENILYCPKSKMIKIIDFGISKKTFQRGSRRDMLTVIGTHCYQAPQVYLGGGYDQRIDLWALGVTIFKLVTDKTPFESEYHSTTIQNIIKCQATFEDPAWNKYSSFSRDFVSRLLKKKQERMTLKQAMNHFWLGQVTKIKRSMSEVFKLHQQFHDEIKNKVFNASSRQQETKLIRKLTSKKTHTLNKTEFDLSDSQNQDYMELQKTGRFSTLSSEKQEENILI